MADVTDRATNGPVVRYDALVAALRGETGVSHDPTARGFGAGALLVNGKIFAMLVRGRLVVKLPAGRVAALVAAGAGVPLDADRGRPKREWLELADDTAEPWLPLAREALAFVGIRR